MKTVVLNVTAILLGLVIGSAANMALIIIGPLLIPPPEGADVTTMEGLSASIHLFTPKHFVFPFLAHALGTFAGACIAYLIARSHKRKFAYIIGVFFLFGGIANVLMLPSPIWFNVMDLTLAYIPMAWLASKICMRKEVHLNGNGLSDVG